MLFLTKYRISAQIRIRPWRRVLWNHGRRWGKDPVLF